MRPRILTDARDLTADTTPAGRYVTAFVQEGSPALIANVASQLALMRCGARALPVTVDHGGFGRSYVASPHSAYALYAREEMDLVGMRRGRRIAGAGLTCLDGLLRAIRFNTAVHLDNWLLSTNLHGDWDGSMLAEHRSALAERFPDHFLILRSLDAWSCPSLLQAARKDGWIMLPARQIWVVDDLSRDWRVRNNHDNDRRALARSGLTVEDLDVMGPADADRIAGLYRMLYLQRYSRLNPAFTPRFVALTCELKLLSWRVARNASGVIMAAAGMLVRERVMTPTVVGYDTSRPQSEALYRIASFMFCQWAMERGLCLHGSAGAASFKRNRGARGVIEYMAVYADHLAAWRRQPVRALAIGLERAVVPMMQREGW